MNSDPHFQPNEDPSGQRREPMTPDPLDEEEPFPYADPSEEARNAP